MKNKNMLMPVFVVNPIFLVSKTILFEFISAINIYLCTLFFITQ